MKTDLFLIQHKQTGSKHHQLKLNELKQLKSDAVQEDLTPLYIIEEDNGECHYLIDQMTFDLLKKYLESFTDA